MTKTLLYSNFEPTRNQDLRTEPSCCCKTSSTDRTNTLPCGPNML